jgi:hypothetical protein
MIRCVSTCLRLPCASTPLHRCSCLDRPGAGVSTDTSPLQSPWGSRPCDRRSTNGTSSGGSNRGRAAPTPLAASQATIRAPTPHSPAPAPEFYLVTERQPVTTAVPGQAAGPQNLHVLGGASVTDIRIDFIDAGVLTTLRSRVHGQMPCGHTTGSTSNSRTAARTLLALSFARAPAPARCC